jgi:hypothetical protein
MDLMGIFVPFHGDTQRPGVGLRTDEASLDKAEDSKEEKSESLE